MPTLYSAQDSALGNLVAQGFNYENERKKGEKGLPLLG